MSNMKNSFKIFMHLSLRGRAILARPMRFEMRWTIRILHYLKMNEIVSEGYRPIFTC